MLDAATIEPVTVTGEWIIGSMVGLVTVILGFVSKILLDQLKGMRDEINQLRTDMLKVMSQSLDTAIQNGNGKPTNRRKPPD